MTTEMDLQKSIVRESADNLTEICHGAAVKSGWWTNIKTGENLTVDPTNPAAPLKFNVPEKLMLIMSEIAEGMEGFRKNLMDDHLPHRPMLEVELADALIRIHDLAGALGYNLGSAVAEKLAFNAQRADHKIENRVKEEVEKLFNQQQNRRSYARTYDWAQSLVLADERRR